MDGSNSTAKKESKNPTTLVSSRRCEARRHCTLTLEIGCPAETGRSLLYCLLEVGKVRASEISAALGIELISYEIQDNGIITEGRNENCGG